MMYHVSELLKYGLYTILIFCPQNMFATDVYGPKPFNQIVESNFTNIWSPSPIGSIQNREHTLLIDAETLSHCLTVDSSDPYLLGVGDVSVLSEGMGTYGNVMRSIFQILDLNTAVLSTEGLTNTYTFHPWLGSYHVIDADTVSSSESAGSIVIRDKNSFYMLEQSTVAFLVFTMTGTPSSTTIQATSRYIYNTELDSATYELDTNWSANQWLKIGGSAVELTSMESEATQFIFADANDLINVSVSSYSDFNPNGTEWQTNSFAGWPVDQNTGEEAVWDYDDSQLNSNWFLEQVDDYYEAQFGDSDEASTAASDFLDYIETTLENQGSTLRYPKDVYLTFRESVLNYKFGSVDMYNSVLGETNVENVYFTNAADDDGIYHPFMVIASHNAPSGPQFLIDVPRPPGDNCCDGGYAEQNVTRNAVLENKLVKIPLKDYGLVSLLTDNNLSEYGTLAEDMNLAEDEWTTDNYASLSSSAIAVDGVMIYPASNNVLVYATFMAEITESGIHVGRGMGFHYHADGHSYNGNGINLYNLGDYEGHAHPPIIGFVFDGISLFGKYESSYSSADGYGEPLDDYNGHTHGDYGYHYHAYSTEVTQSENDVTATYIQHFLYRGAFKGLVNDIPGLFEVSPNQFMNNEYKRYVGATGTFVEDSSSAAISITIGQIADWNLVGLPLVVSDNFYTVVFPDAIPGTLYSFDGTYFQTQELNHGSGYWLRFNEAGNTTLTGDSINDLTINLAVDWNLISGITQSIDISEVDDPDGIIVPGTLYGFSGTYEQVSTLEPGKGYWLRAIQDGEVSLIVGEDPPAGVSYSAEIQPIFNDNCISCHNNGGGYFGGLDLSTYENLMLGNSNNGPVVTVGDGENSYIIQKLQGTANGAQMPDGANPLPSDQIDLIVHWIDEGAMNNRDHLSKDRNNIIQSANTLSINGSELYFGVELSQQKKLSYSLPPKPPAGAFDVRFKDGWRLVKDYGEVEVMPTTETLNITYDIMLNAGEYHNWALTATNGEEYILEGSGELVVPSEDRFTLELKAVVPATFTLHQNFPNPFNPITTLSYDLPEDSGVRLTIFDMLGNEVATLVNTNQQAGFKSVQWDATDSMGRPVSAGVYLYQIQVEEFIQTKKMVLLK